jgi:ribosomal protein S18 acetylase RimI-like enzyme
MIIVRTAAAADVPALRAVAEAAYRGYVPRIGRAPAPMTADYAAAVADGHTWVATRDGTVVGLLVLISRPDHLLLENVAVLPAEQGQGTGSALLDLAEEQARQRGLAEIRLFTNEAMTGNIGYYRRRGYTETHRAQDEGFARVFFRKGID